MKFLTCLHLYLVLICPPDASAITNGKIVFDPATSSSIALVQAFRRTRSVRSHGYRPMNECTGSLISRQVVITAGHCIKGWKGHGLLVKFLNRKKLLLFRKVKANKVFHQSAGVDLAILLLDRPIMVCNSNAKHPFDIFRLPFKWLHNWTDKTVENAKCTMFGFGKNEKNRFLDYELRSMPVRLKAESPNLTAALLTNQKICETDPWKNQFSKFYSCKELKKLMGDSGGPVLCKHNGHKYLIGISTRVTARHFSNSPQLCFLKIPSGEYAIVSGAKFYDIRHGLPQITQFLNDYNQMSNLKADYGKCF